MPQVTFAPRAIRDPDRLRAFLRPESADAARRAGEAVRQSVRILGGHARLGRMVDDPPEEFREWLIEFGDSGYVVRYRIDKAAVTILAIRRRKEAEQPERAPRKPRHRERFAEIREGVRTPGCLFRSAPPAARRDTSGKGLASRRSRLSPPPPRIMESNGHMPAPRRISRFPGHAVAACRRRYGSARR